MQPIGAHLALLKMDNLLIQKPVHATPAESISDVMSRDTDELIKGMRFGGCLGTGERDLLRSEEPYAGLYGQLADLVFQKGETLSLWGRF